MKPFQAPLDDIQFSLKFATKAASLSDWDAELTGEILSHFASFAEGKIAPLDEPGDQQGCKLEDGRVVMPDGFRETFAALAEGGWQGLTAPEEFGGMEQDHLTAAAVSEVFSGANHSMQMVCNLVPGAISTLLRFGTNAQQQGWIPRLVSGEVLSTMCLTEPGAGSDLSRVRCKATRSGEAWRIDGEKIFISGGDQNLSDGILHLVLARTSDDGIKGLSLFLCPSARADGNNNAVTVTRIEEKMGLHASPTCQLAFDGAEAELVGKEGQGLLAMFTMMNHARADVALQGVAHAARAHDIASAYAAERLQGRGPDGAQITLDQHADVRRMLDEMDAYAIGGRAITHLACATMESGDNADLVEFLTPLAKVYCTEAGIRAAELGVQVMGGYGYLQEYRVEQTYRDARITAIYEGANAIHERMMATRLLKGAPAEAFDSFIAAHSMDNSLVAAALQAWRSARQDLLDAADAPALAHVFYLLTTDTLLAALWARIEKVSDEHSEPARIQRLAKMSSAKVHALLPAHVSMLGLTA